MSEVTVCKWRGRFIRARVDGLYDEPRPGAPRRVSDAQVEQVIVRTLEETPRGETHWSSRGMAKASGLGRTTIQQIWRAFGLQPHRTETFKLSTDPLLIEKVRDIVGLYMQPPTHAVVFCVDEKAQIQALDRTQPVLPMRPGHTAGGNAGLCEEPVLVLRDDDDNVWSMRGGPQSGPLFDVILATFRFIGL